MINIKPFLASFFEQIKKSKLDIKNLKLDHIAYQSSSSDDYERTKLKFKSLGEIASEEIIGGRRVLVIKLSKGLKYSKYTIKALELIEPKPDQNIKSDFQHAEFVYKGPFEELIKKYPNINWDTSSMNRSEFAHLKLNF